MCVVEFYYLKVTFKLVGLTSKCDCVAIFVFTFAKIQKKTLTS
eukprot:UN00494